MNSGHIFRSLAFSHEDNTKFVTAFTKHCHQWTYVLWAVIFGFDDWWIKTKIHGSYPKLQETWCRLRIRVENVLVVFWGIGKLSRRRICPVTVQIKAISDESLFELSSTFICGSVIYPDTFTFNWLVCKTLVPSHPSPLPLCPANFWHAWVVPVPHVWPWTPYPARPWPARCKFPTF